MLTTLCLFVVANATSYFLRSDGYGLPGIRDGVVRVGWPFLMIERGGFSYREFGSPLAAVGNFVVTSITAAIVMVIGYFAKRAAVSKRRI